MKKGQTTVFVIIGLVLVIAIGIAAYSLSNKTASQNLNDVQKTTSFSSDESMWESVYDNCMKNVLLDGVSKMLTLENAAPSLEQYVRDNFPKCIFGGAEPKQGFDVTFQDFNPSVTINDNSITLSVTNDFVVKKGDSTITFEKNTFTLPLSASADLKTDAAGIITQETTLFSPDLKVKITFAKGVKALDGDGKPISKVTLKMVPRPSDEILPPEYSLMLGPVMYRIEPDGSSFSPAIEMKFYYEDNDAVSQAAENGFMMGYYNYLSDGQWVAYPTTVDSTRNIITAQIAHFSDPVPLSTCGGSAQSYSLAGFFKPNCMFSDNACHWSVDANKMLYYDIDTFNTNFPSGTTPNPYLTRALNGNVVSYKGKCTLVQPAYAESSAGANDAPKDAPESDLDKVLMARKSYRADLCTGNLTNGTTVYLRSTLCDEISQGKQLDKVCDLLCTPATVENCKNYYVKDDAIDTAHVWRWTTVSYGPSMPSVMDYFKYYKNLTSPNDLSPVEEVKSIFAKDMFTGDGVEDSLAALITSESSVWDDGLKTYDCSAIKPAKPKFALGYKNKEDIGGIAEFKFYFDKYSCFDPHNTAENKITITPSTKGMVIKKFTINGQAYPIPPKGTENDVFSYKVTAAGTYELVFKVKENKYCTGTACMQNNYVKEGENKVVLEIGVDELTTDATTPGPNCFNVDGVVTLFGAGFKTTACTLAQRKAFIETYRATCKNNATGAEEYTKVLNSALPASINSASSLDDPLVKLYYAQKGVKLTTDMMFNCAVAQTDILCANKQPACYDSNGNRDADNKVLESWYGEQCIPISDSNLTATSDGSTSIEGECKTLLGFEYTGTTKLCTASCTFDKSGCVKTGGDKFGPYNFAGTAGSACFGGKPNGVVDAAEQCDPLRNPTTGNFASNANCSDIDGARYSDPVDANDPTKSVALLLQQFHCTQSCIWNLDICEWQATNASNRCNNDNTKDAAEQCDGTDLGGSTCLAYQNSPAIAIYSGGNLKCDSDCTYDFSGCLKVQSVRCRIINGLKIDPASVGSTATCRDYDCTCECKNSDDTVADPTTYADTCISLCTQKNGGTFVNAGSGVFERQVSVLKCGTGSCSDTDSANSATVKGNVAIIVPDATSGTGHTLLDDAALDGTKDGKFEDYCANNTLNEASCSGTGAQTVTYAAVDCTSGGTDFCQSGACLASATKARCKQDEAYRTFTDTDYTFEACCPKDDNANGATYCVGRDTKCHPSGTAAGQKICNAGIWQKCDAASSSNPALGQPASLVFGTTTYYCDLSIKTWVSTLIFNGVPIANCAHDPTKIAEEGSFALNADAGSCAGDDCRWLCWGGKYYYSSQYPNYVVGKTSANKEIKSTKGNDGTNDFYYWDYY